MTTFVIPRFFSMIQRQSPQPGFPVLAKMLSKSRANTKISSISHNDPYRIISAILGAPADFSPSIAALARFDATRDNSQSWLCCATPVVITPNRNQLDLVRTQGFDMTNEEANGFCSELNDYFKDDAVSFSYTSPDRWYLHAETGFDVSEMSPFHVDGQDIAPHIPQGQSGAMWRKIFNEIQMLLHHSSTNHKRTQLGKPEINSVWLWGGGGLNAPFVCENKQVYTDDAFSTGLALRGGCRANAMTSSIDPSILKDTAVYVANLDDANCLEWDKTHFEPALRALKNGQIKSIVFNLDVDRIRTLRKSDLLRFWLPERPISDLGPLNL